ncbi:signal peptidase I [Leifsonia poae]|uniref:signal peptidase I n=1 Tax=Leifsonia poae TaxID=110933 RepID=UPI001CBB4BE3|nr:signal peptidase I [Leifsonia poae]
MTVSEPVEVDESSGVQKPRTSRHSNRKRASRRVPGVIGTVLFTALISILGALVLATVLVPRVIGAQTYTVLTGSMQPTLRPGTTLVVQPRAFDEIRVGDVVTFQERSGEPTVITHRVVGTAISAEGESTLITRGDNNSMNDPEPVRAVQVKGVLVYAIPFVGLVSLSAPNLMGTAAAAGAIFILVGFGYIVAFFRTRRRDAQRSQSSKPKVDQ